MVLRARRPSTEMRSIHRELERRRPKPLAPKRPPAKKAPAPPPSSIGGVGDKVRRPCALLPCKNPSSITCKSSSFAGTVDTEPLHHAPLPPPPCRSAASSVLSASEAIPFVAARLKPSTSVRVRTRTMVKLAAKSVEIWLWLPAIVVSAAADGSYEIVYKGKLPPGDPFATVHVLSDHVVPEKQPPTTPLPSCAASLSTAVSNAQIAASKNSSMQTQARPTTGGKSMRVVNKLATEKQSTPRPTTAGKSIHVVRKILSEMMESVSADGSSLPRRDPFARDQVTPPQPRAASSCPSAASKTSKIQSLRLLPKLVSEMQAAPRPTIAGKCIRAIPKIMSSMEFQAQPQAMLPGY